jgi:hypothetical protein
MGIYRSRDRWNYFLDKMILLVIKNYSWVRTKLFIESNANSSNKKIIRLIINKKIPHTETEWLDDYHH